MNKEIVKAYIANANLECKHSFTVVNWRITDNSHAATQLMCRHCLSVLNFQDVAESCGELKAELG